MKDELKESNWNEDKKSRKGLRGFQSVPDEEQKTERLIIKLTKKQRDFIRVYCKKKEITMSDLVRFMLYDHLKRGNEDFSMFEQQPSNQTNLFD